MVRFGSRMFDCFLGFDRMVLLLAICVAARGQLLPCLSPGVIKRTAALTQINHRNASQKSADAFVLCASNGSLRRARATECPPRTDGKLTSNGQTTAISRISHHIRIKKCLREKTKGARAEQRFWPRRTRRIFGILLPS